MVVLFPIKYHNWVWSHRRLDQVARLVRQKFPRFGDHLLGIVELAQQESGQQASRRLVEAAIEQVDAELADRDLSDAVPEPRHRRWALAAGIPLVLAVIVMLLIPAAGSNALARWATPWRDVERFTFAQLEGVVALDPVAPKTVLSVSTWLSSQAGCRPNQRATFQ